MRYLLMVDGKDAGEWRAASAQAAIEQLALEAPESKLVTVQAISFEPGSTERLQHAALSSTPVFPARAGNEPHARHAHQTPKEHGPRARGITAGDQGRPGPAEARPARAGNHIRSGSCASDTIRDPARRDARVATRRQEEPAIGGDADRMEANMPDRDDLRMFLGVGAVVITLGVGTCSTNNRIDDINRRIDDGFGNVNRRIDDTNRRIDDTNRRIDDMQTDIRELRTLIFEALKSEQAPAN